jgi:arginyl-tRNA synthetase
MAETVFYWCEKLSGKSPEFPEGGYQGEYLSEVANAFLKKNSKPTRDDMQELTDFSLQFIFEENIETLKRMGISFDTIVKESELVASGKTDEAIQDLENAGALKEKEGAVWFAPNDEFLEDRETVVRRSNGKPTYFASDIAYHKQKFTSTYDIVIDVFGSNHHGHVPKLKALTKIFGFNSDNFFVLLYQYVRLKRGSEVVKMAKRAGTYVTAKEVLDEVGSDSMVFSFLLNSPNTHIDFDLEMVKAQSMKNPVYYAQYACVRAGSIIAKAKEGDIKEKKADASLLKNPEDILLARLIAEYPRIILETAKDFEVQRLTRFAGEFARAFHSFYEKEHIVGEEAALASARLALVCSVKQVFQNLFAVIGISAPEKM